MKDNKLLAEYIGGKFKDKQVHFSKPITRFEYSWLHEWEWVPDKDWNQLMMVVEKIEENGYNVEIHRNICNIGLESVLCPISQIACNKIEAVYNACVEYIKQK